MKKLFALLLVLALTLVGCGANPPAGPAPDSAPDSSAPSSGSSGPEAGDGQWTPVTPGKLTVGTSADYAPFEWHALLDGQDTVVGFDMALAKAIADDLGLELEIVDMAFENVLTELKLDKIDLAIAGIVPNDERRQSLDFSDSYYSGYKCLMIRTADKDKYTSIQSLAGLPVGAQTNTIEETLVKSQMPQSQLVSLQNNQNLVMEVKMGTVEAICIESTVAGGYVLKNPDLMIAMEIPGGTSMNAAAVNKGNTQLLEAANATIAKVLQSGQMDQFVQDALALAAAEE